MGNRAVITTEHNKEVKGLYVHWNGGLDSVKPILRVIKENNKTSKLLIPVNNEEDVLKNIEIIYKNIFSNKHTINRYRTLDLDNGDNGVYVVDINYDIIKREFQPSYEQNEHKEDEFVKDLQEALKEYEFYYENNLLELIDKLKENYILYELKDNIIYIKYELYKLGNPNLQRQLRVYSEILEYIKENHLCRIVKLVENL